MARRRVERVRMTRTRMASVCGLVGTAALLGSGCGGTARDQFLADRSVMFAAEAGSGELLAARESEVEAIVARADAMKATRQR